MWRITSGFTAIPPFSYIYIYIQTKKKKKKEEWRWQKGRNGGIGRFWRRGEGGWGSNSQVTTILVIENCSGQNERCSLGLVSCGFSLSLSLPPSHARPVSLWWSLHKMWPAFWGTGRRGGGKKNTLFICFQFHLNDSSPWSRFLCSLTPIPFSHFFISLSFIFFFFWL